MSKSKEEKYQTLIPQIRELIGFETDLVANSANVSAVLKDAFSFLWVGFYFVRETKLVLGPFQGPIACTRIDFGAGVCGTAWREGKTQVVANVHEFPGHIACNSLSQSEIVVPLYNGSRQLVGVLDVDSDQLAAFDQIDKMYLEQICKMIPVPQPPAPKFAELEV